jgi:hypothetical protein
MLTAVPNLAVCAKDKAAAVCASSELASFRQRLDETMQDRFHLLAKLRLKDNPHMIGTIRFSVQDAKITRINWIRKTRSAAFNELAMQSVKSVEGDALSLTSTPGSKPVQVTVTFEFPRPDCRY